MDIIALDIPDVRLVKPLRRGDERGWFAEIFREDLFKNAGIDAHFIQDNQSFSQKAGTIRGLHYQEPPFAQAKLVRVLAGAILDVAVDIRRRSPSYGRHVSARLDASNCEQLFVPIGFAHGFCTLEPDTMVAYKVSALYSREHERGYRWNDSRLAIPWPVSAADAVVSDKDRQAPLLGDRPPSFAWAA